LRTTREPIARLVEPRQLPDLQAVSAAVSSLERQLDRHLKAIDSLDQKASLLPPVLGALGLLSLNGVATGTNQFAATTFIVFALVAGTASMALALACLAPRRVPFGADAVKVALGTSLRRSEFDQGLANSLALCIRTAEEVGRYKASTLTLAFTAGLFGIVCLVAFRVVEG
jgi:hypothetical protein